MRDCRHKLLQAFGRELGDESVSRRIRAMARNGDRRKQGGTNLRRPRPIVFALVVHHQRLADAGSELHQQECVRMRTAIDHEELQKTDLEILMLLYDFAHCLGSFGDREIEQPIDISSSRLGLSHLVRAATRKRDATATGASYYNTG